MTYENRHTVEYAFGNLTNAAAISDTTLTSADFATQLPSGLSTTTYVPVTLQDPSTHAHEVAWVTAHTASATTATVVRGREGTSPQAWPSGTLWTVAPTLRDGVLPLASRSVLPADPHIGLKVYLEDEQLVLQYVLGSGWVSTSGMSYRATQLLAADAASVSFTSIPSTLKQVQLVYTARGTQGAVNVDLKLRINNDTSANYNTNFQTQQQATVSPSAASAGTSAVIGVIPCASAVSGNYSCGEVTIPGWDAPASRPAVNGLFSCHMWDSAANSFFIDGGFLFKVAGPYTSLVILPAFGNLKSGSEFTVYGWA